MFSTWLGWLIQHKANKEIHEKFKEEIRQSEQALINFKTKHLGISRGMLGRNAAAGDAGLKGEVLRIWFKFVIEEGNSKAYEKKVAEAEAKFKAAQQAAKDASKSVMGRLSAGSDDALKSLCMQSWVAALEEARQEKELELLTKKAEDQLAAYMAKKKGEATGVLDRMSAGSDSGLLHMMIASWLEAMLEMKQERELEASIAAAGDKFANLKSRQSGNAKSVQGRVTDLEQENQLMMFFYAWSMHYRVEHCMNHYNGKLNQNKKKLEDVQTMFRSFANQLESGIGNTPRTGGSRSRKSGAGSDVAPPPLPPA